MANETPSLTKLIDLSLLQTFGELTIVPLKGAIVSLAEAIEGMADAVVPSELGAHDLRYYNSNLEYATRSYSAVTPGALVNPSEQGWYELKNEEYVLTADTSVTAGKTYYEMTKTWHSIGAGQIEDERIGKCEQNILAILMALELEQVAEITGTSGNIVVETFADNTGFIVASGQYDGTNHRVWA